MKDETKNKLKGIFDTYDKKQSEVQKTQAKMKSEKELFLDNFAMLSQDVIRPTLDELAEEIKLRGHGVEITSQPESQDNKGCTQSAQVRMLINPNGKKEYGRAVDGPAVSFRADSSSKKVWTHVSTMMLNRGGSAGKRNEYSIKDITAEIVQEEVIHLLAECFGK